MSKSQRDLEKLDKQLDALTKERQRLAQKVEQEKKDKAASQGLGCLALLVLVAVFAAQSIFSPNNKNQSATSSSRRPSATRQASFTPQASATSLPTSTATPGFPDWASTLVATLSSTQMTDVPPTIAPTEVAPIATDAPSLAAIPSQPVVQPPPTLTATSTIVLITQDPTGEAHESAPVLALGQSIPPPSANAVQATVTEIVDGDTIGVLVDGRSYRLRYIGVNTPETTGGKNDPYGREATEFNRSLVEGKTVLIAKDVSETDRYGRILRYVWVDGVFVNAELVRQGYAQVATYPPDVAYTEHFIILEREAREAGRGLWGLPEAAQGDVTLTVLADRLNIRRGPGTDNAILGSLAEGDEIAVTAKSSDGTWYYINHDQQPGWISADPALVSVSGLLAALPIQEAGGAAVQAVSPLSVAPQTVNPTATQAASGAAVQLASTRPPASQTGSPRATVLVNRLNVRYGPSGEYAIIGSYNRGDSVPLTGKSTDGTWYTVDYNGRRGWISADAALIAAAGSLVGLAVQEAPALVVQGSQGGQSANSLAPQSPAGESPAAAPPCNCNVSDYDCGDFSGHSAAQACWTSCGGNAGYNLWRLDADGDGLACERN